MFNLNIFLTFFSGGGGRRHRSRRRVEASGAGADSAGGSGGGQGARRGPLGWRWGTGGLGFECVDPIIIDDCMNFKYWKVESQILQGRNWEYLPIIRVILFSFINHILDQSEYTTSYV